MKKVIYDGKEYEVPNWTRFIATDEDGEIYAFDTLPIPCAKTFMGGIWGVYEEVGLYEWVGRKEGERSSWGDSLVEIE